MTVLLFPHGTESFRSASLETLVFDRKRVEPYSARPFMLRVSSVQLDVIRTLLLVSPDVAYRVSVEIERAVVPAKTAVVLNPEVTEPFENFARKLARAVARMRLDEVLPSRAVYHAIFTHLEALDAETGEPV